jgi:hypothetical protein
MREVAARFLTATMREESGELRFMRFSSEMLSVDTAP